MNEQKWQTKTPLALFVDAACLTLCGENKEAAQQA